jgi:release factor glutamine methyltransferase
VKLSDLLHESRATLASAGIEALDARLLVEHFSATTRTDALTRPNLEIGPETIAAVRAAIARRLAGESVHRIIGHREFYGLELSLSAETLEPRPDTETLVDALLPHVRRAVERGGACRIVDLGTGTGAIALALLSQVPQAVATGVDISSEALATAARNAEKLGLADRFTVLQSDWFSALPEKFHVIAANPPYIRSDLIVSLQSEVRDFDPPAALDGGLDGLDAYRTIARESADHLLQGGVVGLEIGFDQKADVVQLFHAEGYDLIQAATDLAGHDRALVFQRK